MPCNGRHIKSDFEAMNYHELGNWILGLTVITRAKFKNFQIYGNIMPNKTLLFKL